MTASAAELLRSSWGRNVRRARTGAGLTQTALGEAAGLDQAAVSRIEAGRRATLPVETMLALAVALDVDPDELFGWPPAVLEVARHAAPATGRTLGEAAA